MAREKRRRQTDENIPEGLKQAIFYTQDDKKRTVRISALPRKSWIELNERQTAGLADELSKISQKWSNEKIVSATVKCIAEDINEVLSEVQTGGQKETGHF
jgi:hypothetical protein